MADGAQRTPWWLSGNFAPVEKEVEAFNLPVTGALPSELTGVFMRNGPNPWREATAHWFLGDGMVHGVRLEKGKARWYRNRYVRTPLIERGVSTRDPSVFGDKRASTGNTNIVRHAGRIFAVEEAHFPYEITGELETKGCEDFGGRLKTALTAHPKICPETGEMLAFGYSFMPPYLTYHRFDAEGRLVQSEEIAIGGPVMMHDFCATRTKVVFMDLPIVFDMATAMQGGMPYKWNEDYQARLGVMPRTGTAKDVKWFDIPSCYVFHPLNAYDEGDAVILDLARYEKMWVKGFDVPANLHRFRLDLSSGVATGETLDDHPIEFPRVRDEKAGLKHRFGYAITTHGDDEAGFNLGSEIVKFDLDRGETKVLELGKGRFPSEAVFASAGAGEDEGYLLSIVYDAARDASDLIVLDAKDVAKGPVAVVALPQRVPFGFHGAWFAD
ncbi:MAG TPA: carotenoid oxygenase family protein [Parvularculaceae bacterium]|nr:carotenoid oxygenase family protein [Parvularculaceae bacterium]HNS86490.1 carotenoid oxygenase family protein [Parvularculaceae bacterium]